MDTTSLMLSVLFGAVGMGLFMYGKRSGQMLHLGCGIALMLMPYFIPNAIAMSIACAVVTVVPFVTPRM